MTYSRRKPYQRQGYGIREFYRAPVRHLKDSVGPESVFEKPYQTAEYGDMQQSPNVPVTPPDPGPPGELVCQYNSNNCRIYASCFAGAGIKVDGGPEEVDAGYEPPVIIKGALIDWSIGEDSRVINLVFDPNMNQNIVEVNFVDGWGERHTESLNSLCSVAGCSFNPDDDFSGTNGENPDSDRWMIYKNDQSYGALKDGELYYGPSGGDDENYITEYIGNFVFVKNFDIRITFDITTLTQPDDNRSRIGIQVLSDTPTFDSYYASIMRSFSSAGVNGYVSDFSGAAEDEYAKNDTSGKLRIKRVGSDITVWEWHTVNNQWEWDGNTAGRTVTVNDNGCRVKLVFEQENNGDVEAAFDDFEIYQVDELLCVDTCQYQLDDFFTGANNTQPDSDRWSRYDIESFVKIYNNQLRFGPIPDDDWNGALATYYSKFELVGDFELTIDFQVYSNPWASISGNNYLSMAVASSLGSDANVLVGVGRSQYSGERYAHWSWYWSWRWDTLSTANGSLRMVRVGSDITTYRWDAGTSSWVWPYTALGAGSGKRVVLLKLSTTRNWTGDLAFDNFKVVSADGIICL